MPFPSVSITRGALGWDRRMRPTTVERHIIFHHHLRIILWIIIKDMHFQFSSSNNNVLSGTGWANISDSNSAQQRRFIHSSWVGISVFIGFLLAETTSKIDSYILLSLHIIFLGERSERKWWDKEWSKRDFHYYIHYIYYLSFGDWGWTMPFQSFSIFWRFHLRITYVGPTLILSIWIFFSRNFLYDFPSVSMICFLPHYLATVTGSTEPSLSTSSKILSAVVIIRPNSCYHKIENATWELEAEAGCQLNQWSGVEATDKERRTHGMDCKA